MIKNWRNHILGRPLWVLLFLCVLYVQQVHASQHVAADHDPLNCVECLLQGHFSSSALDNISALPTTPGTNRQAGVKPQLLQFVFVKQQRNRGPPLSLV